MKRTKHVVMRKKKQGFSLVELLVATALFTTVVAVSAGSFLSILEASRQSRELNELMLAVDFAMEDMSRTIRTGTDFVVSSGGTKISFFDENRESVTYQHSDGRIQKTSGSLTPDTVTINELSFSLEPSLYDQPRIIINVVGQLGSNPDDTFYLQTSVTQRELNVGP